MIITIDSNIAFSAILNTNSLIGDLLLNSFDLFQFRTCNFLTIELNRNWNKIKKVSKLSDDKLQESRRLVYKNIIFIDERQIPTPFRIKGYELVKDIDINDFAFVSLNEYNESLLWSGDKKLILGLKSKGYKRVINTEELAQLRLRLEKHKKR